MALAGRACGRRKQPTACMRDKIPSYIGPLQPGRAVLYGATKETANRCDLTGRKESNLALCTRKTALFRVFGFGMVSSRVYESFLETLHRRSAIRSAAA